MIIKYDHYKRKSQAWEQSTDQKPKGKKLKRLVKSKARKSVHKDIQEELKEMDDKVRLDLYDMLNQEANEAMYCHHYGPCEKCLAAQEDESLYEEDM